MFFKKLIREDIAKNDEYTDSFSRRYKNIQHMNQMHLPIRTYIIPFAANNTDKLSKVAKPKEAQNESNRYCTQN